MSSLVSQSMLTHLNDEIRDAIEDVGGDLTDVNCPFDYPKVIREQLTAGEAPEPIQVDIYKPGFGIDFHDAGDCIYVSSNSGGIMNYAITLANGKKIPSGYKILEAIGILAENTCTKLTSEEVTDIFDGIFNKDLK